jgi:hypothetical protein
MTDEGPELLARIQVNVAGQSLTQGEVLEQLVARVHRLEREVTQLTVRVTEPETALPVGSGSTGRDKD